MGPVKLDMVCGAEPPDRTAETWCFALVHADMVPAHLYLPLFHIHCLLPNNLNMPKLLGIRTDQSEGNSQ